MTSLVAMIVLAYLLVIAVCVAIWTAVSLRRAPPAERVPQRGAADARSRPESESRVRAAPDRSDTHDAYRGARAKARQVSAPAASQGPSSIPSPAPDRVPSATVVPLFSTDREPLPAAPLRAPIPLDARGNEVRSDGIRVTESKRARERSAQHRSDESGTKRNDPEDAFERFLRANEDFER